MMATLYLTGRLLDRSHAGALYTRASALLMAGKGPAAAQEFQKVLNLRNALPADLFPPYAQLGIARAYALDPDKSKSRNAYQDFLGAWKSADPGLPLLAQAQSEYAKLN